MPELKVALIGAALLLIPAFTTWIISRLTISTLQKKIEENTVVTKQVKVLVDGTKGALLAKIAGISESLARSSGDPEDLKRAIADRAESDIHAKSMENSELIVEEG